VLTHHVAGVDNIEHAMGYPPSVGRAAIRGAVIRRVLPVRQHFAGSWDYVSNLAERTWLDLTHPFETEERWPGQRATDGLAAGADQPAARCPAIRAAGACARSAAAGNYARRRRC